MAGSVVKITFFIVGVEVTRLARLLTSSPTVRAADRPTGVSAMRLLCFHPDGEAVLAFDETESGYGLI